MGKTLSLCLFPRHVRRTEFSGWCAPNRVTVPLGESQAKMESVHSAPAHQRKECDRLSIYGSKQWSQASGPGLGVLGGHTRSEKVKWLVSARRPSLRGCL